MVRFETENHYATDTDILRMAKRGYSKTISGKRDAKGLMAAR